MHEHLTRELFRAVATGWRNPGDLAGIALAHIFELCPDCRTGFESWRKELEDDSGIPDSADYDAVIDRIRARVETAPNQREAPIQSEIRRARSRAEQLLRLDPDQQAEWVRTEAKRFAGPLLAEVLIEEARRRTPAYPRDGFTLASLARLVLHHVPPSHIATALFARSLAYMANAARVIGDLPRADQLMGDARYLIRSQGGGDRLLRAELDSLEASLRIGQDRPEVAVRLLLRSLMTYRLELSERQAAATLIKLARAQARLQGVSRALSLLAEAEKLLENVSDPWLQLLVLDNRASYLCLWGEPMLALQTLELGRDLAEQRDDPLNELRRSWSGAKISWSLGDLPLTEQRLVSVREGFARQDIQYDVAIVSLDLGRLYLDQGRFQEAEELAGEALPVFEKLWLPSKVATAAGMRAQAAAAAAR